MKKHVKSIKKKRRTLKPLIFFFVFVSEKGDFYLHKGPEPKYTDQGKVSSALEVPHDHGTLSAPRRHLKRQE